MLPMRRFCYSSALIALLATLLVAQEQAPPQQPADAKPDPGILKEFTRSAKIDGMVMNFVLLNDKTADVLFQAPGKYAIRARARMSTLIYVQGTPDKDLKQVETMFKFEQNGQSTDGTPLNIKNFEGSAVAKGNRIEGMLQFDKKIDPSHKFKIVNPKISVEFNLSQEALKILGS
jgi:hypothetical protein